MLVIATRSFEWQEFMTALDRHLVYFIQRKVGFFSIYQHWLCLQRMPQITSVLLATVLLYCCVANCCCP